MLRNKNKNINSQTNRNQNQQKSQQRKSEQQNRKNSDLQQKQKYKQQYQYQQQQQQQQQQPITFNNRIQYKRKDLSSIVQRQSQSQQLPQNSLLYYNIKKLLNQSVQRQQKYINFIKQQKQQIFIATQKYSQAMSRYQKQIKQFIAKKQSQKNTKVFQKLHRITAKNPPNLYKKKQYTIQSQCQLNCTIIFLYIVPLINDYLKQKFPQKLKIQLTQYYPIKQLKQYNIQLNPQMDEKQKIQYIKKGYSIQIYKQDLTHATYNFILSHFHNKIDNNKILKYYKNNQIQFMLIDQLSQIILGYGKIDLQYFLQYNQQNQLSQVQKIPILSINQPDKIIAFIHINLKVNSIVKLIPQQHIHKISQPITINKQFKFQTDKQSRLIQRINQYKNIHQNIIPSMTKQSNDKNILMHQKRKQLEQIQSYKQAQYRHKNQFMDKVFGQAIQQFHTNYIEIGQCKYVPFIYTNHTQKHQNVKIKLSYRILPETVKDKNQIKIDISNAVKTKQTDAISVQLVQPQTAVNLLHQHIIQYPNKTQNCVVQYKFERDYVFILMGESIIIFVKTICHATNVYRYQINLELVGDYGQSISNNMVILKVIQPIPTHIFPFYSFAEQTNQVKIQVPTYMPVKQNSSIIGKVKVANVIGCQNCLSFQCDWSQNYNILDLRIKTLAKASVNKRYRCFLFIYDVHYNIQLAAYQFNVQCLQKIQDKNINIGRTQKFTLKFKLSPTDGLNSKTLIGLKTSDYLGSCCELFHAQHKTKQFLAQPNIEQLISINYNTFSQSPIQDKLIISCMDTVSKKSIKKYLLILKKNPTLYHTYRLQCEQDKIITFDFQMYCNNKQETTYKLYSSNYSLMNIQQSTIVMYANQQRSIKLEFKYWNGQSNIIFSDNAEQRSVILAVDDGKNCQLYRFQLSLSN